MYHHVGTSFFLTTTAYLSGKNKKKKKSRLCISKTQVKCAVFSVTTNYIYYAMTVAVLKDYNIYWHYQTKYLQIIDCNSRRNVSRENKLICDYWPFCRNTCSKSGRHCEKNLIVNFLKRRHVANTTQLFKMSMLSLKWLKKISFCE